MDLSQLARIGARPTETEDERVRRMIWLATLFVAVPTCVALGLVCAVFEIRLAAMLMAVAATFWTGQVIYFATRRRGVDQVAFTSQWSCVLSSLTGVLIMGGPLTSGGLALLGLLGPLYALAFPSRRRAVWLFVGYVASMGVGVALADRIPWAQPLPPGLNLAVFVVMLTSVSAFAFAALYFFVGQRDRALHLLRDAEEKIARLLASAPGASDSIPQWSRAMAQEVAEAIGADAIGAWQVETEGLVPLADEGLSSPSLDVLQGLSLEAAGTFERTDQGIVAAVTGMSGELRGALVISGAALRWTQRERRLVAGFAHQLGAALETHQMRLELAAAAERRALTRQEMHDQGIATLQVCPQCGRCFDHTAEACDADGAGLESPRTLPYRLAHRYRFTQVLGEGGMGTVIAAWDEKLQREVAVKLIRPEHFNNPEMRQRFEREARTVARIQHPGVIALHDSGELDDGTAFLVMEKLTGSTLGAVIRKHGRGTPRQVAALVRQGCAALGAAHRVGIVHRDVKPENVFLVDDAGEFRVKVLDFGLAKSMAPVRGLTQTGVVMGTPAYMSPEQVQGDDLDARTDVYSFAAVCYEALTGTRVIGGDDLGRILISVLNTVAPPPSSLVSGLPPEVDAAFGSALAKAPAQRLKAIELWGASFVDSLEKVPASGVQGWPSLDEASAGVGDVPLDATVTGAAPRRDPAASPSA